MYSTTSLNLKKRPYEECASPFSEKGLEARKKIKRALPENIIHNLKRTFQSLFAPSSLDSICAKYEISLCQSNNQEISPLLFAIIDQIILIEQSLIQNSINECEACRIKIKQILHNPNLSFEEQMGELGMIYYYLDRDGAFFEKDSYIGHRADEIQGELNRLKEANDKLFKDSKSNLASGRVQYLLTTFSHMIVSRQQKFNLGGTYALSLILKNSKLSMGFTLSMEHRRHILSVLDNIEKNQFKALLESQFSVHPDLQDMIRADLKLSDEIKVTSTHAIWDSLMSLLFDLRQPNNQPNCYAISSLIYVTENAPYKLLESMIKCLENGYFSVNKEKFSISLLLQKRLSFTHDLVEPLHTKKMTASPIFQKIFDSLGLYDLLEDKEQDFDNFLTSLAEENLALEQLSYIKKIFYSFKHNFLTHMVLSIIEFQGSTSGRQKRSLIDTFMNKVEESLSLILWRKENSDVLLANVRRALEKKIWFADCSQHASNIMGQTLEVDLVDNSRTIDSFSGDLYQLKQAFSFGSFLLLKQNENDPHFTFIEKISDLQNVLIKIIQEETELCLNDGFQCKETSGRLQKLISGNKFAGFIAEYTSHTFKFAKLPPASLVKSDLLIFSQLGGNHVDFLDSLGLNYESKSFQAVSPKEFFSQFKEKLQEIDLSILERNCCFLCEDKEHAFTLSPENNREIWAPLESAHEYLERLIFFPVKSFLSEPISSQTTERIFDKLGISSKWRNKWDRQIQKRVKSYDSFRAFLLTIVQESDKDILLNTLDSVFYSITLKENEILELSQKFGIVDADTKKILEELNQTRAHPPYILARKLSHVLRKLHLGLIPCQDLEDAICELKNLPQSIEIGDLNWRDEKEVPYHSKLVIRYHFGRGELVFLHRDKNVEKFYQFQKPIDFKIYHPKF